MSPYDASSNSSKQNSNENECLSRIQLENKVIISNIHSRELKLDIALQ